MGIDDDEITAVIPMTARGPIEDPPANITATLEVLTGAGPGLKWHIRQGTTVIGRDETADIHIDDPGLSRRHAAITYQAREFRIGDLESANGTFLNGSRVKEYALRAGDKLLVGETLLGFMVVVQSVFPVAPSADE